MLADAVRLRAVAICLVRRVILSVLFDASFAQEALKHDEHGLPAGSGYR
jgi:hypothetical protein